MQLESNYQAAKIVAPYVERQFRENYQLALENKHQNLAIPPTAQVIEKMIDTAFWASLRREEGNVPKISMAFVPAHQADSSLLLDKNLSFTAANLTKLASGVERAGIHLGIWHHKGDLYIWGITLSIPDLCFVLDVSEPGLLVVKYRRFQGFGKFANVAVLMGDQVKVLSRDSMQSDHHPALLASLLGLSDPADQSVNVLLQLAVSMRSHRHGGTLLVVPARSDAWKDSILQPIKYAVEPVFRGLADLLESDLSQGQESGWRDRVRSQVDYIGGLTAIDGATLINERFELIAFGTKIGRKSGSPAVSQLSTFEPILGYDSTVVHPSQNGGTRHLSACQFVHDQRNALALVASQDGQFSVFFWSEPLQMVQVYLIESLLL